MKKTHKHSITVLYLTLLSAFCCFGNSPYHVVPTSPKDSLAVIEKDTVLNKTSVTKALDYHPLLTRWQKNKTQNKGHTTSTAQPTTTFRSFPELEQQATSFHYDIWDDVAEFTQEYIAQQTDENTQKVVDAATELFSIIQEEQRFIDIIGGNEIIDLPVGLKQDVTKNSSITLGIISMEYHKDYTVVDLFAHLELNELNIDLFFGANGVKISKQGGIYDEARLNLLADFPVPLGGGQWLFTFLGGKGEGGQGDGQTYITIDCEGKVKELAISADVRVAKTVAVPLNEDGSLKYPGKTTPGIGEKVAKNDSYVGTTFKFQTEDAGNLLLELDLPMFQLRALPKWGFKMENVVLDLSDTKNSESLVFPEIYRQQGLLVPGNENLWRGFYSKEVRVVLPPEFKKKGSTERISIGAKDLFIDNFGVSGEFYAENILDINEGDASKWQFSVDSIGVDLKVNRFIKAGFNGEIVLPTSKKEAAGGRLAYQGLITADQYYSVNVDVTEDVDFNIFKAKAKLFKESYVKLEVEEGRFYPEANLTGLMSFSASQQSQLDGLSSDDIGDGEDQVANVEGLEFDGLSFQDFKIMSRERPYLSIGYAGFKDSISLPKLAGFELGFYDIQVLTTGNQAELALNSYVNLDKSGIRGDVRLSIVGELKEGDFLKWNYKGTEVSAVEVDVKRKAFEFKGRLEFFKENDIYGKGFAGELQLYSEHLGLEIGARGLFGAVDDYRYWFVDANGRPTRSENPNFTIYDLGGGLYHHMRKAGMDERANSLSGIYYTPDRDTGLGFKALAAFEVKKGASFTGLIGIEMSFNSQQAGGGVSRLGFYGGAMLIQGGNQTRDPFGTVADMQQTVSEHEQALGNFHELSLDRDGIKYFADEVFPELLTGEELFAAQVAIDFDFRNRIYWGLFDVFLNAGPIKGDGEKNRLGYLEFYNAPDDWYIYVGTPTKRFGLQGIPIGPVTARINMYFMTGTILPDPALPPQKVIDILNLKGDELLFGRNFDQELAQGTGYAFGAQFEIGREFDWGIVYADVNAGVGFDLMMRDFGDAYCRGSEGPLGMDGWYATGQLYAYLQGEMGAQIKLFGIRKRVPILKAGVAVLAQAQLPNPWFIKGYAGIDVRVLGVVRIRTRLKVVIGEECEIIGKTGLQEVVMISDISPGEGYRDVDVFDAVQVAFNAPVGSEFQVEDDEGLQRYRIHLNEFAVSSEGNEIKGEMAFNNTQDLLSFESFEVLPPQQEIKVVVKVSFEKKNGSTWEAVSENGVPIIEEKQVAFSTGNAPRKIPYRNIEYMYPVVDQRYMLPKESRNGYVQLDRGQEYLFGNGYSDELYFLDSQGNRTKSSFSYDAANKRLNFSIPDLINETSYTYALVTLNPGDIEEENVLTAAEFQEVEEGLEISNNTIVGGSSTGAFISRLDFQFTTSKHDTFKDKIRAMQRDQTFTRVERFQDTDAYISGVAYMSMLMEEYEPFGINDVVGTRFTANTPFIATEALLTSNYYTKDIWPLVYTEYPLDGDIYLDRDENELGVPPTRSIQLSSTYAHHAANNPQNPFLSSHFPYRWHQAIVYYNDFKDLQYQISNRYLRDGPDQAKYEQYEYLIWGRFPYIRIEEYDIKLNYLLPKQNTGNSAVISYKNILR